MKCSKMLHTVYISGCETNTGNSWVRANRKYMKLTWQYDKENWLNTEQILLLTLEKVYVEQFSAANHLLDQDLLCMLMGK